MSKTLIIAAHPNISQSIVHRHWLDELRCYPEEFSVHELYSIYPQRKIDVIQEQLRLNEHEKLILQFPIYWFNCPPLMKQWLDDVLTHGWAYGSQGKALTDKVVSLAVSLSTPAHDYQSEGRIGHTSSL